MTLRAFIIAIMAWAAAALPAAAGSPQYNYMLVCSGCHGVDGAGSPENRVPSLRGTIGHFLKVPNGREFLIQVPGTSHSHLSDAEVAELANWMLKAFSAAETPPGTPKYTKDEVSALRANPLTDVPAARAAIINQLRSKGISVY